MSRSHAFPKPIAACFPPLYMVYDPRSGSPHLAHMKLRNPSRTAQGENGSRKAPLVVADHSPVLPGSRQVETHVVVYLPQHMQVMCGRITSPQFQVRLYSSWTPPSFSAETVLRRN